MEYRLTFGEYQRGLASGRILGLKCQDCGQTTFPPRAICEHCGGHGVDVTEMKGQGEIRTFTVIRVAPEGMQAPYVVAMVELEDGPWVMGRLVALDPDEADMDLIGRRVTLGSEPVAARREEDEESYILTFTLM